VSAIRIRGVGLYVPGDAIDNPELSRLAGVEFDVERLEEKIGIRRRHIARLRGSLESTADFATRAAELALSDAGVDAEGIGLFIVGTDTPEFISPSTAIVVQGRLQRCERYAGAFDINASCASFTIAFDTAARILASDPTIAFAVVVGAYNMPAYLRDGDGFGYSIFADGAAAIVLERTDGADGSRYLDGQLLTDGTQWDFIGVYAGGTRRPVTSERLAAGEYGLQLLKPLPGQRNVQLWPPMVKRLLAKAGRDIGEIDHILFTQINRSVILKVLAILGLSEEKTTTIMDRYGYTGSACIPMAFYHAVRKGRIKRGDLVMFVASGAGLAVGANLFVY